MTLVVLRGNAPVNVKQGYFTTSSSPVSRL